MAEHFDRRHRSGWGLVLGVVLCVLGATVPTRGFAAGGFQTGNTLLAEHDSKSNSGEMLFLGYVAGFADVLARNAVDGYRACIPEGVVSQGQVRDVVVKWLRAHPEKRHYLAASLVAEALQEAFPCKR